MVSPGTAARVHGGADAHGAARWDFSTCANAAGPCPAALAAVQAADATRYPDPAATAVRQALGALHDVEPSRILPAASASEFIQRVTAVTARLWPGAVRVPRFAYGDYAAAAAAWGRPFVPQDVEVPGTPSQCTLRWHADPTSPLGQDGAVARDDSYCCPAVLDAVYAPLRLQGASAWTASARDAVFVLHSPNKALGLTGVRGAYAVAPRDRGGAGYDVLACRAALEAAAPSWPLSAHAEAMLLAWATPDVHAWVAESRTTLVAWKSDLLRRLSARGFEVRPSVTPYVIVRPPRPVAPSLLRRHHVAVRDATSFGLPGWWRLSAQAPSAQDALMHALDLLDGGLP
ncbi:aminotransferase (plasmid) [Methylibium petroleiphilum PM1]|uniref:Aminotransferase n=1 Tax=Methylibium petroleiphilum (strain ATCC BAA-1232 / LMG 22953 / PM1) TaxID=420662 RepID=A2SP00_METPP|nr:aminotransferase [Methylibium petroleiphilum PM1]